MLTQTHTHAHKHTLFELCMKCCHYLLFYTQEKPGKGLCMCVRDQRVCDYTARLCYCWFVRSQEEGRGGKLFPSKNDNAKTAGRYNMWLSVWGAKNRSSVPKDLQLQSRRKIQDKNKYILKSFTWSVLPAWREDRYVWGISIKEETNCITLSELTSAMLRRHVN